MKDVHLAMEVELKEEQQQKNVLYVMEQVK